MSFAVSRYDHPQVQGDASPTVVVLEHAAGHRVEVWPASGFNAFRWAVPGPDDHPLELLYADPALFTDGRPTRSGVPVLFPFPNRIAGATFAWAGRTYTLPVNDPAQKNAIHGFACRSPWDVIGEGADDRSAWVTGRHRSKLANPWPASYELTLTISLREDALRLDATVQADGPLPFGLGYHPYFAVPFGPGLDAADCLVQVPAASFWELDAAIPTGSIRPVDPARDLNAARPFGEVQVDDVLTDLPPSEPTDGLYLRGQVMGAPGLVLQVLADAAFRDVVVFTPPHRHAFCIEPYTCPTDAVHLTEGGIACGWRTLAPGATATFAVEFRLLRGATLQPTPSPESQP